MIATDALGDDKDLQNYYEFGDVIHPHIATKNCKTDTKKNAAQS